MFTEHVLRTIRRELLIQSGDRVLVAVSGGPDSVAMLQTLHELAVTVGFTLAAAAHFNHRLRGGEADADEQFCRELAARMTLPFTCGADDVRERARREKRSIEDSARRARYEWLERAAERVGADCIAVGHTRDDQAETVLLKLFRGAGPRGLGAIYPRNGRIVRPLLDVSRHEVLAFLADRGLTFRVDATNADSGNRRNFIRHELLPQVEARFGHVREALSRTAALCREDTDWFDGEVARTAEDVLRTCRNGVEVDRQALSMLHPALARRIVRLGLAQIGSGFVGFDDVAAVFDAAAGRGPGRFDLPGRRVTRTDAGVRIESQAYAREMRPPVGHMPLDVPGEAKTGDWIVTATVAEPSIPSWRVKGNDLRQWRLSDGEAEAQVDSMSVHRPLAVRGRRQGDRLKPLGGFGRQKLQDLLVDRKVPRRERDALPLVVDADDRIVWVPGCAIGHDFRVTTRSAAVIILKAKRLGGW